MSIQQEIEILRKRIAELQKELADLEACAEEGEDSDNYGTEDGCRH